MTLGKKLIVNQSISRAKHVELIYYKVRQSLLKTGEIIKKCVNLVTKWDKQIYKVGQLRIIKGQTIVKSGAVNPLQNGSSNSLQNGSIINAKCGKGEALLQSETTIQKRAVHPSGTRANTNLC